MSKRLLGLALLAIVPFLLITVIASAASSTDSPAIANSLGKKAGPAESSSILNVKLAEDSGIRARNGKLVHLNEVIGGAGLDTLQAKLDEYGLVKSERLFKSNEAKLDSDQIELTAKTGKKLKNLNNWLRIEVTAGKARELATELKKLNSIENAYPEPIPSVSASPNLVANQRYRNTAPGGVDSLFAFNTTIPGAKGENVKVADIEGGWNREHEDITKLAAAPQLSGECSESYWVEHGNAVTSIIAGDNNAYGVTGIVPNTSLLPVSFCAIGTAPAIDLARQNLSPGDIMNIELQYYYVDPQGNAGEFVPVEYYQAEYDAISAATAAGIIVTEAGSNGSANLDDPKYGGVFTTSRTNSGAIMVGAGWPSNEHIVATSGVQSHYERSRIEFSAFGSRVDVQAWGYYVTSAGYGNYNGEAGDPALKNSWYTNTFAGTSSATAIVAGVAASASSAFEAMNGRPATPQEIKDLLKQTGSPQDSTSPSAPLPGGGVRPAALPGNIGPLPNLRAALVSIAGDTQAPTIPSGVVANINPDGKVVVKWNAATDNISVANYQVYRGTTLVGTTAALTLTDSTAPLNTALSYTVRAVDSVGNVSAASAAVSIKTPFFADSFTTGTWNQWTTATNMTYAATGGWQNSRAVVSKSAAGPASFAFKTLSTPAAESFYRTHLKLRSAGANNVQLLSVRTASGAKLVTLFRNTNGFLAMQNNVTGAITASTTPINLNVWYDLQLRTKIAGTSSISEVWLNGIKVGALTKTHNLGTAAVGRLYIGETNASRRYDVVFDNVQAGTAQLR